jgi:hypothetical protein
MVSREVRALNSSWEADVSREFSDHMVDCAEATNECIRAANERWGLTTNVLLTDFPYIRRKTGR